MGDNVGTAKKIYDDPTKGDVEAVLGAMDHDVEWWDPRGGWYQASVRAPCDR